MGEPRPPSRSPDASSPVNIQREGNERLKRVVIVVDDEEGPRQLSVIILKKMGCKNVVEMMNGEELLEKLPNFPNALVVLDNTFKENDAPVGLTGIEVFRIIKGNNLLDDVTVILNTGDDEEELRQEARKLGGTCIKKGTPDYVRDFKATVEKVL